MIQSREKELCKYCKYRHQEFSFFDGGVIYLTVNRCKKGYDVHCPEPECEGFKCNLKYKLKNIIVRW
jgi:hypothetical protein